MCDDNYWSLEYLLYSIFILCKRNYKKMILLHLSTPLTIFRNLIFTIDDFEILRTDRSSYPVTIFYCLQYNKSIMIKN